jgi:hypothetical protein
LPAMGRGAFADDHRVVLTDDDPGPDYAADV